MRPSVLEEINNWAKNYAGLIALIALISGGIAVVAPPVSTPEEKCTARAE